MPKVMIVVLVAIAMLFVITLGLNAGRPNGDPDPKNPPAVVDGFEGLSGGGFLEISGDVTSNCDHTATQVTVSGQCSIVVPSRGRFSKPLRVVAQPASGSLSVSVQPNEGDSYDSDGPIPRDDIPCFETAIDHNGATISMGCGVSGCQVELRRSKCS